MKLVTAVTICVSVIILSLASVMSFEYLQSRKIRRDIDKRHYDSIRRFEEVSSKLAVFREEMISGSRSLDQKNTRKLWTTDMAPPDIEPELRIAHAGGIFEGKTYTNSIDALEHNKSRFSLFEIDMIFTSDGRLVCAHDWSRFPSPPSYQEVLEFVAENYEFKSCTLDQLVDWLNENPDARIVTDTKEVNSTALAHIAEQYPDEIDRFIPQIYRMEDYEPVRGLGFDDVILTLYQWSGGDDAIVDAARGKDLFAVTIPAFRAPYLAMKFKNAGHRVYAHTINTEETFSLLRHFGVDEIYTDSLFPK